MTQTVTPSSRRGSPGDSALVIALGQDLVERAPAIAEQLACLLDLVITPDLADLHGREPDLADERAELEDELARSRGHLHPRRRGVRAALSEHGVTGFGQLE